MTKKILGGQLIGEFKVSWPSHGLPDELDNIQVELDRGCISNIELWVCSDGGELVTVDWREFNGEALSALVQDCIKIGRPVDLDTSSAVKM